MKDLILYAAGIGIIIIPFIVVSLITVKFFLTRNKNKPKKEK